jgi:hypothetical protein
VPLGLSKAHLIANQIVSFSSPGGTLIGSRDTTARLVRSWSASLQVYSPSGQVRAAAAQVVSLNWDWEKNLYCSGSHKVGQARTRPKSLPGPAHWAWALGSLVRTAALLPTIGILKGLQSQSSLLVN